MSRLFPIRGKAFQHRRHRLGAVVITTGAGIRDRPAGCRSYQIGRPQGTPLHEQDDPDGDDFLQGTSDRELVSYNNCPRRAGRVRQFFGEAGILPAERRRLREKEILRLVD